MKSLFELLKFLLHPSFKDYYVHKISSLELHTLHLHAASWDPPKPGCSALLQYPFAASNPVLPFFFPRQWCYCVCSADALLRTLDGEEAVLRALVLASDEEGQERVVE